MPRSVYLAGPIAGLTYSEATDWREDAIENIVALGYEVFSPMREKAELRREYDDKPLDATADLDMGGPFGRDIFDIDRADIVLANLLDMQVPSMGTMFELGYAYRAGKFIIIVIEPVKELRAPLVGKTGYHPFLEGARTKGAIVHSIDAAYRVLRAIQPVSAGGVSDVPAIKLARPLPGLDDLAEGTEYGFAEQAQYMDLRSVR